MQGPFINVTIYDQTTKKSRTISVISGSMLSQIRQKVQKQFETKDFKFINDGAVCIKGTQKHIPIQMYLKPYNTITVATQRQQPKKQSKIIQKKKKKDAMISYSFLQKLNSEKSQQMTAAEIEEAQKLQKHFKWTKQNIDYCKFKYEIQLSDDGYALDHDNTPINIQQFIKYDWTNVEWLSLYNCGIDDVQWRQFVKKAAMFFRLKILGLKNNMITTVKLGDLESFRSLKLVQFGTLSGENPLSKQSKQYLTRFKKEHRDIKVRFKQ